MKMEVTVIIVMRVVWLVQIQNNVPNVVVFRFLRTVFVKINVMMAITMKRVFVVNVIRLVHYVLALVKLIVMVV